MRVRSALFDLVFVQQKQQQQHQQQAFDCVCIRLECGLAVFCVVVFACAELLAIYMMGIVRDDDAVLCGQVPRVVIVARASEMG